MKSLLLILLSVFLLQLGCSREGTVDRPGEAVREEEEIIPVDEIEMEESLEMRKNNELEYDYEPLDDELEIE